MKSTYFSLMNSKNRGFMSDVDQLIEQTPLDLVLQQYGLPLSRPGTTEYRMTCVFSEACSDSQYGNLSVKLDSAKRIYCHACETKGNLLTLLHGLETNQPPTGGRLRGQEFKSAVATLRTINGLADSPSSASSKAVSCQTQAAPKAQPNHQAERPAFTVNVPMRRHEKEAARELANLHEELITDVSQMSPDAAAYVRKRPWMTSEVLAQWGIGWIPGNGRSLFRKNYLVYTQRDFRGDVVSYSGRDLTFESKWEKWLKQNKPEGKKPNKHRYVAGFHRGAELYGGQASRLKEPYVKESLANHGVVVVESANNVVRLACLGVCAVGLCSNKATLQQVEKVAKFAKQVANRRVMLLPDCDEQGEAGFKELLWRLAENGLDVKLGVSSQMFDGKFAEMQPEDFTSDDWNQIESS
jgi:5S rRNA maturation endonuclease (ribonuclease M5)